MTKRKYIPAQLMDRIAGFSPETMMIFLAILVIIFMTWHPLIKVFFVFGVFYGMTILPSARLKGQSISKWLSKTVVVTLDEKPASFKRMHGRELFKWSLGFLTVGVYFVVALVMFSKRLDRRTPHDLLFKTKVIYKNPRLY